MSKENYFHKIKELPEITKQFGGLVLMMIIVILSFAILNNIFGEGEELVAKMKIEEERIANTRKLDKLISSNIMIDSTITSPPYNIGKEYEKILSKYKKVSKNKFIKK